MWAQQQQHEAQLKQHHEQGIALTSSSAAILGSGGGVALSTHHSMMDSTVSTQKQQQFEGFTYIAPHQIGKAKGILSSTSSSSSSSSGSTVSIGGIVTTTSTNPALSAQLPQPPPLAWGAQSGNHSNQHQTNMTMSASHLVQQGQHGHGLNTSVRASMDVDAPVLGVNRKAVTGIQDEEEEDDVMR